MILPFLQESSKLLELHTAFQDGRSVLIEELWNAPKALTASLAQRATGKHLLILTGASQEESKLFHDLSFFTSLPILEYPAWETLPNENIPPSPDKVGERYDVLKQLLTPSSPLIIITSLHAILQKLIPRKSFESLYHVLKVGQEHPFESTQKKLDSMGYRKSTITSDKGEYTVRGGLIDIFPVSSPDPFRIEFWGDEITSIRKFDPVGQKSVETVTEVQITPAQELEFLEKNSLSETLIDYLGENTLVILDDLLLLEDKWASLSGLLDKKHRHFCLLDQFLDSIAPLQKLFWPLQPIEELSEVHTSRQDKYYSSQVTQQNISFQIFNRNFQAERWKHPFFPVADYLFPEKEEGEIPTAEELLFALSKLKKEKTVLHFLSPTEAEQTNLKKKILELPFEIPSNTCYHLGYLSNGLVLEDLFLLFPTTELTKRYKIRRQKLRSTYHSTPSPFFDLTPGDMIVHFHHGIGRFLGMEKRPNQTGIESEFFLVEYAENGKLYVPINQAHLISKYIGTNEESPKLHSIGGSRWKRAKENTEQAILGYASELLQLYAKRQAAGGFIYPPDGPDTFSFEEEFPFAETEDQLRAVAEIKQDMCSPKAMDRLICGDVGYGKTEVAMRAAFKAVVDGDKQVALLVPTTVLAMQHYENFKDRMRNFPINIGVLSRFQTSKETKKTIEGLINGTIDIVVGTHRLISQDILFKNLGLVIIDEEQRFGVKAKEHLKKIKIGVDCLTLSATPIPRTLYMSLMGAREMSLINTPPQDRLPIKTIIAEPETQLIKNALLRELSRDGQAYVIHNRVETIYQMHDRIKALLPQARVGVVHGQMETDAIDTAFHAFKNGLIDILIATSLIENGIDIPNANTILIDRAERFGLADLYQLRGRVGRWNRTAYAYFLIPKFHALPEISRKRLNALAEACGYGGGMKLAMRDLEIRGAGDILGIEQSGYVSAIGFHLYCKLLKRAIKALEKKNTPLLTESKVDFSFDARLPESYVNAPSLRMEFYQRLGDAISFEEIDDIFSELKDRFGPPPEQVLWLYAITRIRSWASLHHLTKVKQEGMSLLSEKQVGKKLSSKRQWLGKIQTPEELEKKVLNLLKGEET